MNRSKKKLRAGYSGALQAHWQWSVALAFSLLILDVVLLAQNRKSGVIALSFIAFRGTDDSLGAYARDQQSE